MPTFPAAEQFLRQYIEDAEYWVAQHNEAPIAAAMEAADAILTDDYFNRERAQIVKARYALRELLGAEVPAAAPQADGADSECPVDCPCRTEPVALDEGVSVPGVEVVMIPLAFATRILEVLSEQSTQRADIIRVALEEGDAVAKLQLAGLLQDDEFFYQVAVERQEINALAQDLCDIVFPEDEVEAVVTTLTGYLQ
jgi:hypothetical protein